jgi:hypothetical protein
MPPPVHPGGHGTELTLPIVPGIVTGPQFTVCLTKVGQLTAIHSSVTGPNVPFVHVALKVPVHPAGHRIELVPPSGVLIIVTSPHCAVDVVQRGQLPGVGIHSSVTDPNVPFVHVALKVPVHPVQHWAELTLPLVVPGIITSLHCAGDVVQSGQL